MVLLPCGPSRRTRIRQQRWQSSWGGILARLCYLHLFSRFLRFPSTTGHGCKRSGHTPGRRGHPVSAQEGSVCAGDDAPERTGDKKVHLSGTLFNGCCCTALKYSIYESDFQSPMMRISSSVKQADMASVASRILNEWPETFTHQLRDNLKIDGRVQSHLDRTRPRVFSTLCASSTCGGGSS